MKPWSINARVIGKQLDRNGHEFLYRGMLGTVVGIDPAGLMNNVLWDGEFEVGYFIPEDLERLEDYERREQPSMPDL